MHHHHLSDNRKKLIAPPSTEHQKYPEEMNWPVIIRQWESSGVPQKEFCRQRALSYSSFVFRRMQLKKMQHSKPAAVPRLLPVKTMAESVNPPSIQAGFVVQWPNGLRLHVPPHADAATLGVLFSCLGGVNHA